MKKIDFLFFWETKVREIESIILIGTELEKREYTIEYVSFAEIISNPIKIRRIRQKGVRVAVMPSLYHDDEIRNIVYEGAGDCEHIVNLRWEQIFKQKEQKEYSLYQFPKGHAKNCMHLCWGFEERKELIESGISPENVYVTGPIQMDFVRKEYRSYFLSRSELFRIFNLDLNKKTMLFISSFTVSSMSELNIRVDESQPGQRKGYLAEKKKQQEVIYDEFLRWLEKFLIENKDIDFIYRPHPVERKDRLNAYSKKYNNLKIISEMNVKQWILCCDYICTWVSTSIAEAYFAGVKCAIIRPTKISADEEMTTYKNAKFITNIDDFVSLPQKKELFLNALDSKTLNDYYYINPDKPVFKSMADILENRLSDSKKFCWDELNIKSIVQRNIVEKLFVRFRTGCFHLLIDLKVINKNKHFTNEMNLKIDNYIVNKKSIKTNTLSKKEFADLVKRIENVFFNNKKLG